VSLNPGKGYRLQPDDRAPASSVVRGVWEESKGEFEGPCDPSERFRGLRDK